jgi:hypothetical protein
MFVCKSFVWDASSATNVVKKLKRKVLCETLPAWQTKWARVSFFILKESHHSSVILKEQETLPAWQICRQCWHVKALCETLPAWQNRWARVSFFILKESHHSSVILKEQETLPAWQICRRKLACKSFVWDASSVTNVAKKLERKVLCETLPAWQTRWACVSFFIPGQSHHFFVILEESHHSFVILKE